jgi:glutathione S-transferase
MSHELTLFGIGTSRTMRAHWMLLELGLDYESQPVQSRSGETLTDQFRRLNPRHKVPVLQHGSFVLTESAAIVQYLSETFADPAKQYVPHNANARATLNEWCYFIMTELDASSLYVVRRHDGLASIYGSAPAAVESAKAYFLHNLEGMMPRIDKARYVLGELLSTADI